MKVWHAIIFSVFCLLSASDIYTPSMPDISLYFGVSSDAVQATITGYFIGTLCVVLICGFMTDFWGERRLFLGGTLVALVGSLLCCGAWSNDVLVFGRILQGFGAVAPIVGTVIIQRSYPPKEVARIFSLFGMVVSVSPAVAPAIGGVINDSLGWRFVFGVVAGLLLLSFGLLRKTLPPATPRQALSFNAIIKNYGIVLRNRQFLGLALSIPFLFSAQWFYLSFLPFYTHNAMGIDAATYGVAIGAVVIPGFMLGSYLSRYLPGLMGPRVALCLGPAVSFLGMVGLFGIYMTDSLTMWSLCGCLVLLTFGKGVLFPLSVPWCLSLFEAQKGTASSTRGALTVLGGGFGAFAAELIDDYNFQVFCLYMMAATLISVFCAYYGGRPSSARA